MRRYMRFYYPQTVDRCRVALANVRRLNDITDEDGDDSAQYSDDDFATYLNKILESQLDDNSKFKDDLEDAFYDSIGSSEEIQNNERDHESEAHSSLVGGYQFVSGYF